MRVGSYSDAKGDSVGRRPITLPSIMVVVTMVVPAVVMTVMVIIVMDALKFRRRRVCEIRNPRQRGGLRGHCETGQNSSEC